AYDNCRTGYQWTPGQAAIAAIGQGYVTVTPLQLARAYAALANGGTLYGPRIGAALLSPTGAVVQRIRPPVTRHLPVPRWALGYIRSALTDVVSQGTAAGAFAGFPLNKVQVAAKTGTAEIFGGQATSVFASFAPASDPKYVVVVMVPKSGEGADVSAPCARQIWDSIYGLEGHHAVFPDGVAPAQVAGGLGRGGDPAPAGLGGGAVMSPGRGRIAGLRGLDPVRPGPGFRGGKTAVPALRSPSLWRRALARDSMLRHVDWILVLAVLGLSLLGTLLVWSATAPGLSQAGADP